MPSFSRITTLLTYGLLLFAPVAADLRPKTENGRDLTSSSNMLFDADDVMSSDLPLQPQPKVSSSATVSNKPSIANNDPIKTAALRELLNELILAHQKSISIQEITTKLAESHPEYWTHLNSLKVAIAEDDPIKIDAILSHLPEFTKLPLNSLRSPKLTAAFGHVGASALHHALAKFKLETVKYFYANRERLAIDFTKREGRGPKLDALAYACMWGNVPAARFLLAQGLYAHHRHDVINNGVLLAAMHGQHGILELLRTPGTNRPAIDFDHDLPIPATFAVLAHAQSTEARSEALDALLLEGADPNMTLTTAEDLSLVQQSFSIPTRRLRSMSLLHLCAEKGFAKESEILLLREADMQKLSHDGYFPTDVALQNKNYNVVSVFLARGYDIFRKNRHGLDMIDMVLQIKQQKNPNILTELKNDKRTAGLLELIRSRMQKSSVGSDPYGFTVLAVLGAIASTVCIKLSSCRKPKATTPSPQIDTVPVRRKQLRQ